MQAAIFNEVMCSLDLCIVVDMHAIQYLSPSKNDHQMLVDA